MSIPHRLFLVATALCLLAGCTLAASPSMSECEAFCVRQGKTVSDYRVGTAVPVFKRHPSVVCSCG